MTVIRRIPWTKQPPAGTEPDPNHPLGPRMRFFWNGANPRDNVVDRDGFNAAGSTIDNWGATQKGMGLTGDGSTSTQLLKWRDWKQDVQDKNVLTIGLFFRLRNTGDTTQRRFFSKWDNGVGDWFIRKREESGTGVINFFIHNTANVTVTLDTPRFNDTTEFHFLTATYDGTNARLYLDGNLEAGPTAHASGGSTLDQTAASEFALMGTSGEGSQETSMDIPLAFVSYEYANAEMVKSLSDNPWQVFAPRYQILPVEVAAAAPANPKGPLGMPLHGPFAGPVGS